MSAPLIVALLGLKVLPPTIEIESVEVHIPVAPEGIALRRISGSAVFYGELGKKLT